MSLAGRLTAFFLATLAVVLIGFSATLYLLAHTYLYRQVDDRLEAALDTLAASSEATPEGVEWEPQQQRLSLGQDVDVTQVRWAVYAGRGRLVDHSRNLGALGLFEESVPVAATADPALQLAQRDGQPWGLRQRRLQSSPAPSAALSDADERQRDAPPPLPPAERGKGEGGEKGQPDPIYPVLILRAAVSLQPLQATLRTLVIALPGLSVGVWLLAALLGRRLCRRALAPVTCMADTARAMNAVDLGQRLPGPGTHDELADLGTAFNDLLSRLQEAFERQRRFTGAASHQLRTPLAVMLGQVEVALRRERPPAEYQRVLEIVAQQTGRLQRIVEMLLFLARADAESAAPELTNVPVGPWLQDHLRGWAAHPRASDIRLVLPSDRRDKPDGSPARGEGEGELHARAHAPLLGQVVDILLDNACKYSRPGTPITVSYHGDRAYVRLVVEDQGCGIDPSELPHVFDPFYRSPRLQDIGGVGLGLTIARRVTDALGGLLEVQSEPGHGSRFGVRLARGGVCLARGGVDPRRQTAPG